MVVRTLLMKSRNKLSRDVFHTNVTHTGLVDDCLALPTLHPYLPPPPHTHTRTHTDTRTQTQTDRHRQTDKQTDRQTHTHTHTHTPVSYTHLTLPTRR